MRSIIFRLLAGLLALAFAALLLFGDTTQLSWRDWWGRIVITVGFGLYALLGTNLAERVMLVAMGGKDRGGKR